jgi:hypothetical protein
MKQLLQLFYADIAIPNLFSLVLKTYVSLIRTVFKLGFVKFEIDNLLAVENDRQIVTLQSDDVSVPLASRFNHVLARSGGFYYAPTVMVPHILFAVGVQNLNFKAAVYMVFQVANPQENP